MELQQTKQRGSIVALTTGLALKRPQMNLKQTGVYATAFEHYLETGKQRCV